MLALIGIGRLTDQALPMVLEHGKEGSVIFISSVIPLGESIAMLLTMHVQSPQPAPAPLLAVRYNI